MKQGTFLFDLYDLVIQSDEEVPGKVSRQILRDGFKSSTEVVREASSEAPSEARGPSSVVGIRDRQGETKSSTDSRQAVVGSSKSWVGGFDSF
jgi:hypothetical protein